MLAVTALAVAVGVVVLAGRGGSPPARPASANPAFASPETVADVRLRGHAALSRRLPRPPWLVSLDLRFVPGGRVVINPGAAHDRIVITGGATPSASWRGRSYVLHKAPGWGSPAWRHVELRGGPRGARITIDGQPLPAGRLLGRRLVISAPTGAAELAAVIISSSTDPGSLPLHRLAELHARLPAGAAVLGADGQDQLHMNTRLAGGFWAGALWQAAALDPSGGLFAGWAERATSAQLAEEDRAASAQGGQTRQGISARPGPPQSASSASGLTAIQGTLAAWRAFCRGRPVPSAECERLVRSALGAAATLETLAGTNPGAGTIPTSATAPVAETDIDSMMAVPLLTWAARIAHRADYARLALHQAHVVGALLVRSDGSTAEAVRFDRSTGRIRYLGTEQGLRTDTTWSRGEGEALYGFAAAASELRNTGLLGTAQRIAGYVSKTLPASGIPAWDDSAAPGAMPDLSAAAITAAGMFRLSAACHLMSSACSDSSQYAALGSRVLRAVLAAERTRPPLGYLGGQVLNARATGCWCNGGELVLGLTYALEALNLEHRLPH